MINKKVIVIVLILLLFNNYIYSQTRIIQILTEENKVPISNVEVYNGKDLISTSDTNGFIKINYTNVNSVFIVKDGYKDKYLNVDQIESNIILSANKPIELQEIIIKKLNNNAILDSIRNKFKKNEDKYIIPSYFKMSNILKSEKDTLHYINSRFKYDKSNGFQIKENSKIIKKFFTSMRNGNEILTYNINEKKIEFWEYLTVSYIKLNGQLELVKILNNQKKYKFKILSDNKFYKIIFESNKNGDLSFDGYFIADKDDFGILELKLNLANSRNDNIKFYTSEDKVKQKFNIISTDYFIKYVLDDDKKYNLVFSYLNTSFIQLDGNFKNIKFDKTSIVESSFNYEQANFQLFDIFNYNVK